MNGQQYKRNTPNERKSNQSGKQEHLHQTLCARTRLSESANQGKCDTIGFLHNTCLCVTRETLIVFCSLYHETTEINTLMP